ncbi:hypothetical protein BDW59DRAFT_106664 [Aspergillus cavernicola]|uniref:HAUS augmin-like complex subunit 6 N-terminus-domain-containing protein n=1 Tax=Aspergillus cavernicola TaxID=176166 RepID=A0ABR4I319_9EURO
MAHSEGAPDGSALTWIFDHLRRYPGTYEIPLRTMYALNCNPSRQPAPGTHTPETAFARRPTSPKSSAAEDLQAQLTHQISRLPSQPCSLPPSFITSFLRRCFAPQLEDVDFPQALTSLDYLKDFETRRKKEVTAALQRLGLAPDDLKQKSEFSRKYPGVIAWIESINMKGRKVEALYTQIYIGLRRWTLLNEMLMEPINKANCIAMLNTLFPPVTEATVTPTSQLTPQILKSQRDGFFRYISAIETNGKQILDKVIAQGAPEGESTGWPLVRDALDKYLRIANEIIDECAMVNGPASFDEGLGPVPRGHKGRKADSGISFGSLGELPAPSIISSTSSEDISEKPLPPSPKGHKGGSTLERLARELRKLGDGGKAKGLRKMKSTNTLNLRNEAMRSSTTDEESFFELDDQKRKRLLWAHSKQSSGSSSRFD